MRNVPSRIVVAIPVVLVLAGSTLGQTTTRLSVVPAGTQADRSCGGEWHWPSDPVVYVTGFGVSGDGRYVAFCSAADNLLPGDTNGMQKIFVRERATGTLTRVSQGMGGAEANGDSFDCTVSADGRYVAFYSPATNLVPGDANGVADIFVRDLQTGSTVLASVGPNLVQANGWPGFSAISADGRWVVFESDATNLVPGDSNHTGDVFLRDLAAGGTYLVSFASNGAQGDGDSYVDPPSISADGHFVAFTSNADNLVPGDTNQSADVFVHDDWTGATERVSVSSSGAQANDDSFYPSISADGRYVAFTSNASNLVPGDANGTADVFLRDRLTGTTTLLSWNFLGNPSSDWSSIARISGDGSHVVFLSLAADMVSGDANGIPDIFVQDLQTGGRTLASLSSTGVQANGPSFHWSGAISTDGRLSVFASGATNLVANDTNGCWDVFLHDLQTGATTRESVSGAEVQGNGASNAPALSDGARFVAFSSGASNLVPGDSNNRADVFVRDLQTGATTLASVATSGAQANQYCDVPQVSADGRYVAFFSIATTLVPGDANGTGDVFVRDVVAGTTELATLDSSGNQGAWAMPSTSVSMSANGRYVAFTAVGPFVPADTNGTYDYYVRDRTALTTIRASVSSSGAQGDGQSFGGNLSADGRYAVFSSNSTNLVAGDTNGLEDVFVRDLVASTTTRASLSSGGAQADGQCLSPSISPDGRFVTFWSDATSLVAGDTNGQFDIFVRDLQTNTTTRESVDSNGLQGNGMSFYPSISRDGRYVVFVSDATNLVPGDTNGATDVFLRDRLTGQTTRVSVSTAGVQGDQFSSPYLPPVVSRDGRLIAFASYASNLVAGDTNGAFDVFLRDRGYEAVFVPFCFGDGTSAACPCGNSGAARHGCQNSASTGGALLSGTGSPSLSSDTVVLTSTGELPTATSILLQGPAQISPVLYGDGLRCTGGSLKRLFTHGALGGAVSYPAGTDPSISARSAALGAPIPVGATRYYQVYYRDPNAGFCAPPMGSTFNISNAVAIFWGS